MNARNKLNVAYFNGSLLIAAIIGAIFQSWLVFFIILVIGVVLGIHNGDIRPVGRNRRW